MIESRGSLVAYGPQFGSYGWTGSTLAMGGTVHLGDINLTHLFRQLSYAEMFRRHPAVFTVVDKRGDLVARLPLKVYQAVEGGREELRPNESNYARLLSDPSSVMSRFEFVKRISIHDDLYGEFVLVKLRNGDGVVVELVPVPPFCVEVSWDEQGRRWYDVHGATETTRLAPSEVVHHRRVDPENPWRGLSPLEPLRATLDNTSAARQAMASFWARGARPGLALKHPGVISQGAADRLKAQFESIAAGAGRTGSTVVLEEGMTPEKMMLTAEEAQYMETRKYDDREVFAAYHMPPTAVGDLEHATYSNVTENLRSVYRDTIAPRLQGFESTFASQLRPEFPDDGYAEFLMDEVLRGAFEARATAYQQAINAGWMTPAEVRRLENLPFIEGSDTLMANGTMAPVAALASTPPDERAIEVRSAECRHSLTTKARLAGSLAQAWRNMAERHAYVLRRNVERARRRNPEWQPAAPADVFDEGYHRSIVAAFLSAPLSVAFDAYGRDDENLLLDRELDAVISDLRLRVRGLVDGRGDLLAEIAGIATDLASDADGWADDVLDELERDAE